MYDNNHWLNETTFDITAEKIIELIRHRLFQNTIFKCINNFDAAMHNICRFIF